MWAEGVNAGVMVWGVLLDHGTGVVIGETAVIGNNVSLLQVGGGCLFVLGGIDICVGERSCLFEGGGYLSRGEEISVMWAEGVNAGVMVWGVLLDHGTGVVIGETAVIGNNVSLLQVGGGCLFVLGGIDICVGERSYLFEGGGGICLEGRRYLSCGEKGLMWVSCCGVFCWTMILGW